MGIGGAEAFHGQWLDLQPYIDKTGFDMSQFPEATVDLYNAGGEGQVGIPYAIYPSVLFYKADMFEEAGLAEPPHEWNSDYTMPDGSTAPVGLRHGPRDRQDPDRRRERRRRHPGRLRSGRRSSSGASSRSATTCARPAPTSGPAAFMADDGKTAQIPEAWAAAWKHFYDGIWTDHFSMTGPQFETTDLNPAGYPFCAGKVAMSTNYLWSTYCVGDAGDDWNMAAAPAYEGTTTAAFNADTWRILKSSKNPDQAFEVLQYLLANEDLLALYGGMPAVESKQDAFLRDASSPTTRRAIDWKVAKEGVAFADVPNFESYMPAYNQTLDLINTTARSGRPRRVSTSMPRSRRCGRRCRPSGTPAAADRWSPPASRARAACPASPGWPGGARAGGTCSSPRGSSASCCSRPCR